MKGVDDLNSVLTSAMKMKSLVFTLLGFALALVQDFFTILPSLPFGVVM